MDPDALHEALKPHGFHRSCLHGFPGFYRDIATAEGRRSQFVDLKSDGQADVWGHLLGGAVGAQMALEAVPAYLRERGVL